MVLPATACTLDPLHVASEPRVAAYFADLVPVLGATTQVPGPLAFACCCQASLPLGGLLVTVGAVCQFGKSAACGGLQYFRECLLKGLAFNLRDCLGPTCQRLYYHLGYGLFCSHDLLLLRIVCQAGYRPDGLVL